MTTKDNGGPAFPLVIEEEGCITQVHRGMTLRAWLTGQALAGLMANPEIWESEGIGQLAVAAADCAMEALSGQTGHVE